MIAGVAQDARALVVRAAALGSQCERLAGATQEQAARATYARAADRLSSSVVRPLAAALEHDAPAESAREDVDVTRELHELALEATRLRVRAAGAPSLQEAAAALQDLA